MPFKNKEYQRVYRMKWYRTHKQSELAHVRRRRKELRKWFEEFKKTLKCSTCNENHPAALEFHHLSKKTKENSITNMVDNGNSIERIKKEMEKCIILCSNCHKKVHYKNSNI